jgi:hypothetical protein
MAQTLNDLMQMDHVILVADDGAITEPQDVYAPELNIGCNDDGQISADDDRVMVAEALDQGWTVLKGWSGQYCYSGPIMHASEYVGGALEQHIRETPGYWVATMPSLTNVDGRTGRLGAAASHDLTGHGSVQERLYRLLHRAGGYRLPSLLCSWLWNVLRGRTRVSGVGFPGYPLWAVAGAVLRLDGG